MGADMESLACKEGCALLFLSNTEHLRAHCFHLERDDGLIMIGYCSGGEKVGKDLDLFSFFFSPCLLSDRFSPKPVSINSVMVLSTRDQWAREAKHVIDI